MGAKCNFMEIKKVENTEARINTKSIVTVKKTGNVIEIKHSSGIAGSNINIIDKDHYVILSTGEIREVKHTEKRIENTENIKQSMKNLRDIINTNCDNPENCLWLTLTYKENMQNQEQLYADLKKFFMRLRYHLDKKFDYIATIEPQSRGAYHAHVILIFDNKRPFIPNGQMSEIWGHGFTKTTRIDNVDDVGLYLTAYLTDISINEASISDIKSAKEIKEIETLEGGKKVNKKIIKGGRLKYYPSGFRLYRCSRSIKRPEIWETTNQEAMNYVTDMGLELSYEKTIKLVDESKNFERIINYRQYKKQ